MKDGKKCQGFLVVLLRGNLKNQPSRAQDVIPVARDAIRVARDGGNLHLSGTVGLNKNNHFNH